MTLADVGPLVGDHLVQDLLVAGRRTMDERGAEEGERRPVLVDIDHPDAVAVDDGVAPGDKEQVRQVPGEPQKDEGRARDVEPEERLLPVPSAGGRHGDVDVLQGACRDEHPPEWRGHVNERQQVRGDERREQVEPAGLEMRVVLQGEPIHAVEHRQGSA